MADEKFCQGCHQKHRCQEVYERLSKMEGSSVVLQVVEAFLIPLVVFICSLAVFVGILAKVTNSKGTQTLLSFLAALLISGICILIIKAINRALTKNK